MHCPFSCDRISADSGQEYLYEQEESNSHRCGKKAGVSQSAVSMILNEKYNVSFARETVQRVEKAAEELGYSIEKKKGIKMRGTIFVVCPNFTNPYVFFAYSGNRKNSPER